MWKCPYCWCFPLGGTDLMAHIREWHPTSKANSRIRRKLKKHLRKMKKEYGL